MKMTRKEIGEMLGYIRQAGSIQKIHTRHKNILSKVNGRYYYNDKGIIKICKISSQPKRFKIGLLKKSTFG